MIAFTSKAPTSAAEGGLTYTVTAKGGKSGDPVTFSSGATSVCIVAGSKVSFVGVGTCVIDAHQAGNSHYSAATATQRFAVKKG